MVASTPEDCLCGEAISNDFRTFSHKGTCVPVLDNSKPVHALTSFILLKINRYYNVNVTNFMAHVVAGGHKQRYQGDYETLYETVLIFVLTLLTLILTFTYGWFCKHVTKLQHF